MKVVWSPEAKKDLLDTLDYIEHELDSPMAAARLYDTIKEKIRALSEVPGSGVVLKRGGQPTEFRYAIAGNFMIFVTFAEDRMRVIRILYGRSDYMRTLFE